MACNLIRCFGPCNNNSYPSKRSDQLARSAFQSMSFEEQEQVHADLYGFNDPIDERADFVDSKLEELDKELELLSEDVKKYYIKAIDIEKQQLTGEKYVSSKNFRLSFLRADRFDARAAARRLVSNFQEKYKLFGEEKLACRIKQADLNEDDKRALASGALARAGVDAAGRIVMLGVRKQMMKQNIVPLMRALYYLFHHIVDDNEEAQKDGFVMIGYIMNEKFVPPSMMRSKFALPRMTAYALPLRFAAMHTCYDDLREHLITNLMLVVFPRHVRARFQGHFHKRHEECILSLITYGIDADALPLTRDGEFQADVWNEYLESQRRMEESTQSDLS